MPPLHRYLGSPVLSGIGRVFFQTPFHDFHCGLRGFTKKAYNRMGLRTTGMEFASEMVVKASLFKLHTCEVPTLFPRTNGRESHTSAAGTMAGGICVFCFCTALVGFFCIRGWRCCLEA